MRKKIDTIQGLVLFVLYSQAGGKCGFEKLVKDCFSGFPQVFGLKGYPKLLDARKVEWSLQKMRKKKLVLGDPAIFFSLTSQGRKQAQEIAKGLRQKKLL